MGFDLIKMKNDEKINKKLIAILTALYGILLIWVVVFKCNYNEGLFIEVNRARTLAERLAYNAVPFEKFILALESGGTIAIVEILALVFNIICFLPLGGFLRFFVSKRWQVIAIGAFVSFAIETFQLFSGWGGPDVVDLVTNTLGAVVGVFMYDLIRPKLKEKTINSLAFWASVVISPVAIFAVINSIINFPG